MQQQVQGYRRVRAAGAVMILAVGASARFGDGEPAQEIVTLATIAADGSYGRVDLVDGGVPAGDPGGGAGLEPARRAFVEQLMSVGLDADGRLSSAGKDLDADLTDSDDDGIPDAGFDSYSTGLAPAATPAHEARIIGANNLYDLFQTTLGRPDVGALVPGFPGYNGGDVDGDGVGDGGPGLFANAVGSSFPRLSPLPHVMGAGRGGEVGEQHQFLQLDFPYVVDPRSLFDPYQVSNSYFGHQVSVMARWVEQVGASVVDRTDAQRHVSGVAILGGVCAVPVEAGSTVLARVHPDPARSGIPVGARPRVHDPDVLTYVAHEDPRMLVTNPDGDPRGWIDDAGLLHLPTASDPALPGGRVFGANQAVPDAVNDHAASGDDSAARLGFVSFEIRTLRTSAGEFVGDAYFHTFEADQSAVGDDPAAPGGSFSRGPLIQVTYGMPAIAVDADPDELPARPTFELRFDKEVVPDSVGFSRRHTLQRTDGQGVVFPFGGNARPVASAAAQLKPGAVGAPLASSIYLAASQEVTVGVNNPYFKDANFDGLKDDGSAISAFFDPQFTGLEPFAANTYAELPRGVVPCDIRPLNQNNLQAYRVEPLADLPAGLPVTLGVCMPGLGSTALGWTNRGNFTEAGTVFDGLQILDPVGLPDPASLGVTEVLANEAVIKVNAGPMDLNGKLFAGGSEVALDTLIDGDVANDATTGGTNIARTFRVDDNAGAPLLNAPVAPEALYAAFGPGGLGILDLNGRGFTTNKPSGTAALQSIVTSRYREGPGFGFEYWEPNGSVAGGDHGPSFGLNTRYSTGGCFCIGDSTESDLAVAKPLPVGPFTVRPGVNHGSSGPRTWTRDSRGRRVFGELRVGDLVLGAALDTVLFDASNPWAITGLHGSANPGGVTPHNTVDQPPVPNPPPLAAAVGLPYTYVGFDQDDLLAPPRLIDGAEVFTVDASFGFDDGSGALLAEQPADARIHLITTADPSNPFAFDLPAALTPADSGFTQRGPAMRTATDGARVLTAVAALGVAPDPGALVAPKYTSRQKIGNYLFATDTDAQRLLALDSNTLEPLGSLELPDPRELALTSDLGQLWVSNGADASVSVVDADPRNATFLTELARIPVADGPAAIVAAPDGADVFVVHPAGDLISILDRQTFAVRKVLDSPLLDEPTDLVFGMREDAGKPGFESGVYHGFVVNAGGDDVLVYESGPAGVLGLGFDDIIGSVPGLTRPRKVLFDPAAPLDAFRQTVGCFVLHEDARGQVVVSRVAYTQDTSPGPDVVDTTSTAPGFGGKTFEVVASYRTRRQGSGLDLALPDFDREAVLAGAPYNLASLPPAGKAPVASLPGGEHQPRWQPGQLWVSVAGHGLTVFDLASGSIIDLLPSERDVTRLTSYFAQ